MNRDDVIRMASQAGSFIELAQEKDIIFLQKFANLIASHVAEECAKAADLAHEYGEDEGKAIRSLYKPTA